MSSIKQLPSVLDISLVKGDDFTFSIHSSVDLSTFQLHAGCGDQTFKITPISSYDYDITITKQQSNSFVHDKSWTLEWVDSNGSHRTILKGTIKAE